MPDAEDEKKFLTAEEQAKSHVKLMQEFGKMRHEEVVYHQRLYYRKLSLNDNITNYIKEKQRMQEMHHNA